MAYYEPQTAKKVYLYQNGTKNSDAKRFVVSERQVRDFGSFLNRVTSGLRAPAAVRNIYTPMHGTKVRSLDELVSGKYYVAGGSEQFKKVKYGAGPKLLPRRQQRVEFTQVAVPHVIIAESRYKRPVEKPYTIHLFRNGDEHFHGRRVLLHRSEMASWDNVLQIVTEKAELNTPAKRLCTLDGEVVTQVQDGGKYVAVEAGKLFRKVAYCSTTISPLRRKTRPVPMTLPVMTRRWQKPRGTRAHPSLLPPPISLSNTDTIPRPQPPPIDPTATLKVPPKRKVRPMAGRRNKEARERALLENRDDSVFGGSPVMQSHPRMPSPPLSASTANLLRGLPASQAIGEEKRHSSHVVQLINNDVIEETNDVIESLHGGGLVANNGGVVKKLSTEVKPPIQNELPMSNLTSYSLKIEAPEEANTRGIAQPLTEQAAQNISEEEQDEKSGDSDKPPVPIEEANVSSTPLESNPNSGGSAEMATNGNISEKTAEGESNILGSDNKGLELANNTGEEEAVEVVKEEDEEEKIKGMDEKDGEEMEEDSIREISIDEGQVEEEETQEVKINLVQNAHKDDQTSKTDPEEVVEEEGVVERSEVKEDPEEPKMRLQEQDVELVSDEKKTSVDLTMNRKTNQQPLIDANEGGSNNVPTETGTPEAIIHDSTQPGNTAEEERNISSDDTPADPPPTDESQATPPAPPTDDGSTLLMILTDLH